jgi:thioredoxin/glutathione reductase (selenoprotein)
LAVLFPTRICVVQHEFPSREEYRTWLIEGGFRNKMPDPKAFSHSSSPFCWTSSDPSRTPNPEDILKYVGGHDDSMQFARNFCNPVALEEDDVAEMVDDEYSPDHEYDYDLVVIGGGSGGLACSKEAAALGAKVAVLDFVKPSPQGTVWGLGGTCVNVGCIPKKLMHYGATLRESIHADADAFGIGGAAAATSHGRGHQWKEMKDNVQNHIRGLNFKYRVNLRESNVTYLNKFGTFIDKHTLEVTDKKGKTSTLTSSRFIVAVGGRPTPLDCEGGELAISSDDIFALKDDPGKVLCVGASYISLECAGFLAGLGHDITVAVRSILLRGFDRECAEKIGAFMEDHGVKFRKEVVPKKLEKLEGSMRITVTFSDGSMEEYDNVLVAIGRTADTKNLQLDKVGVPCSPRNGKISATYEQTATPSIYVIGDCMEGCPELTPVAIEAGLSLARRLFGGSKKPMDYKNICTAVFTPMEYGTVGMSEEDAVAACGEENLDVYHKSFFPLEWTLSESRQRHQAFTKVVVDRTQNRKVLGIHYLGPNAGEIMQGYGVAMKKGITFQDLEETVGIHPTSAEEIVTLKVTKRSGKDAAAGGC